MAGYCHSRAICLSRASGKPSSNCVTVSSGLARRGPPAADDLTILVLATPS